MTNAIINQIRANIERLYNRKNSSAWNKGLTAYANELLDELEEAIQGGYFDAEDLESPALVGKALLNGADDWKMYSWGGCSLIYNYQIAERLCNKSELKRTKGGELKPNKSEEWLDTQARALYQAHNIIRAELALYFRKVEK